MLNVTQRKKVRKPVTVAIAVWSSKHRWLVFGLWFGLIITFFIGVQSLPPSGKVTDPNASLEFESIKAGKVFDQAGGTVEPTENFFLLVSATNSKVTNPAFQNTITNLTREMQAVTYQYQGKTAKVFETVFNPFEAPAEAGLISDDQTTVRIFAQAKGVSYSPEMSAKFASFPQKLKEWQTAYPGYKILAVAPTLNGQEANDAVNESLGKSLIITLIPTFLILLLVFGALVASIIPLILALSAILATVSVISLYANLSGETDLSAAVTLAVLMGLAIAVDYSLFFISRYRSERQAGRDKLLALEVASGTAGRAVFFSGMLVAISICGLFLLGGPIFSMALGTVTVVILSVVGSFTFLPATLAIVGRGVDWGRLGFRKRGSSKQSKFWTGLVGGVMQHKIMVTVVTTALLLALAFPLTHLRLGQNGFRSEELEAVKAAKLLNDKWPKGSQLKLVVVVTNFDTPQTKTAAEQFSQAVLKLPGISGPVEVEPAGNGKVVMLSFIQSGSANDQQNWNSVSKIRQELVPQYFGKLSNTNAYVTGSSAVIVDNNTFFLNSTVWIFVLSLSFLVLLLVFHSLVIAVKAILLNLLSTGAAYGVVILVYLDGITPVKPTGVLESWLPVLMFTIIFGLSMDYHLFILTRIKELRDQGYSTYEATASGISSTAGIISGAAGIMLIVFGDFFVELDLVSIQQLGLGLAVAVFLDAVVVRSLLLPAVMGLMGEANWWLPGWLKWLPQITIESEPQELMKHQIEKEPTVAA